MINLLFSSPLSLSPSVSPMSHGWPSTRTKYLTEENCLPCIASASLASSVDSCALSLEPLENLSVCAISGLSPSKVLLPTDPTQFERWICIYLSFGESAIVQISQIETPWEGAHDRGALAFLFLQNIHKIAQRFPGVCFWVLYKQLLLQRGKERLQDTE